MRDPLKAGLPDSPGVHRRILELEAAPELRCGLALPTGYTPDRPLPLILGLHYGWDRRGRPPRFYGKGYLTGLVEPALSSLGAILVAPDCPGRDWTDPRSEGAVLSLLDHLRAGYRIDPGKVAVTGYSLGGMGAWHMAAHHAELFSAAIPVSGWPQEGAEERIEGVPLYIIHSRGDELIPIEPTLRAVRRLEVRGQRVEFVVLDAIPHFETGRFVPALREAIPWIRAIWAET